jgi:transposase
MLNTKDTIAINPREQRGQQIAATAKIKQTDKGWVVPSQSRRGSYLVTRAGAHYECGCPDYETRRQACKHIYAVELTIQREVTQREETTRCNGQVTHTLTTTVKTTKRVTYRQDWPAYNRAQTQEKAAFQVLLHDLCQGIQELEQTRGRPRHSPADLVFSAAFKVYSTFSGRRFMTDLREAHAKGHISKAPHYNSIFRCFESAALTPLLRELITVSSLPLKAVETDFAVDSSGFSTCRFVQWFNARYGHEQDNHDWLKLHLMCGVKTNIVTSVEVSGRHEHDAPFWPGLVETTARHFTLNDVSGDKAYSSKENLEAVARLGGTPFVPFKYAKAVGAPDSVWVKMWHFYQLHRERFLGHYHQRSNAESTFNMIKAKFGSALRSKTDAALLNEALLKVLCHNICCVIQSMHELGIKPRFAATADALASP